MVGGKFRDGHARWGEGADAGPRAAVKLMGLVLAARGLLNC